MRKRSLSVEKCGAAHPNRLGNVQNVICNLKSSIGAKAAKLRFKLFCKEPQLG